MRVPGTAPDGNHANLSKRAPTPTTPTPRFQNETYILLSSRHKRRKRRFLRHQRLYGGNEGVNQVCTWVHTPVFNDEIGAVGATTPTPNFLSRILFLPFRPDEQGNCRIQTVERLNRAISGVNQPPYRFTPGTLFIYCICIYLLGSHP